MSYILDALRRSQAERERGQVPGLGAQPAAAPSSPTQRRVPPMLWLLVGASVLVLLAGAAALSAWWVRGSTPAPVLAAATPAVPVASAVTASAVSLTAPAPAPAQVPPVVVQAPLPTVVSAPPAAVVAAAAPVVSRPAAANVTPAPAPAPVAVAVTASAAVTGTPAGATPAVADSRPIPLAQLTAEQRRDLPPLVVSGSIWSDSPSSRFVMLNGQVVREGDTVVPGLKLERIAAKSAVLRWRDLRIEIGL